MATHNSVRAIDIHHHYVPLQLIEESRRHGEALGVAVSEVRGSYALSFAGSKPHRLQPPIFDDPRPKKRRSCRATPAGCLSFNLECAPG